MGTDKGVGTHQGPGIDLSPTYIHVYKMWLNGSKLLRDVSSMY